MARTPSRMVELGTKAPAFRLPDTNNKLWSPADFASASGLLVMFLSNHCPYVQLIRKELAALTAHYINKLGILAIMSNDVANYPDDAPAKMKEEVRAQKYLFPYLYDESQSVAHAYQAACTPDFFLFDKSQQLVYRGQFDDARPGNGTPVTGRDLRAAIEELLAGKPIAAAQKPSLGCNIKWKMGNEPK